MVILYMVILYTVLIHFITECDAIYHSNAFFKLSLKMWCSIYRTWWIYISFLICFITGVEDGHNLVILFITE